MNMNFINPDIESSYQREGMGEVLYSAILELGAKKIIDYGILNGYSTVCMAMAAKQTGGIVCAYDLFDDYEHNNAKIDIVKENLLKYDVLDIVRFKKKSFYEWIKKPESFDVLHVDISNTGDIIEKLYYSLLPNIKSSVRVFFEGGSIPRDNQDWMIKYEKIAINSTKNVFNFKVHQASEYYEGGRLYCPSISELIF
jgi:hypothetical protein